MTGRCFIAVCAGLLVSGAASAQDDRALELRDMSEAAEIRVVLPPAAADHPALRDEMLAEGRELLAKFRSEAQAAMAEAETDPDYPWHPWSLDYVYEPRYLGPVYGSFLVNIFTFQGGAHPQLAFETVTRDLETNTPVTLDDLFFDASDGSPALVAISDHVQNDIARQKEQRTGEPADLGSADWLDAVAPRPENFELFTFVPARQRGMVAGLTFHFPPYAVGAYAEGPFESFVPASVFSGELADFFPQVFGGEPLRVWPLSSYEEPGVFAFLEAPEPETLVASPLQVAGEVPRMWFDGGAPLVRVADFDGNVLGEAEAVMQPDRPAAEVSVGTVPFQATVEFGRSEATEGQLVIVPPGEGSEVSTFVRF
ncbi:DUF3298 domain-containing protein [Lutibaculum baratangense]|uniref:DUF3298 domain-containing protein n=1 Tax=Lutibaculum baratangense AMV1 TaxID=631454 RepID=V4QSI3_9HYPH|nr:DUF3298 domain-containing protein [Lutibaculum baratangense]ESR22742.1 uncharacterized protein N177_3879 [Lutibaculum baratangense AMV1]